MSPRVLIIDAEADFAGQLSDTLQLAGVETTLAADGKAGLDLAKSSVPTAIVVCVELPRMSGYSVCTKIRKDDALKAIPVIITSSGATPETFESHSRLSTRANEYLKKPFPPAMLLDVLRPYLGEVVGEPEPIDGEEIDIVDDAGTGGTLSDEEAFSQDEAASMAHGDATIDTHSALGMRAAVAAESVDEAEALTTVGFLDPPPRQAPLRATTRRGGSAAEPKRGDSSRSEISRAQQRAEETERGRDEASSHFETGRSSIPSSAPTAAGGRELLELKKERNTKEKEILALKEQLNDKERQLLAWSDKETELEGEIVRLQETLQVVEQAKHAGETKAAEQQRALGQTIADLKRRLSESNSREADLDSTLQAVQQEMEGLRQQLGERERAEASLSAERDALVERLEQENAQLNATAEALRASEQQSGELTQELDRVRQDLERTTDTFDRTASELQATAQEVERLTGEVEAMGQEIEALRNERDASLSEQSRLNGQIEHLSSERARLGNELSAATAEAQELREQLRAKDDEAEQFQQRISDLEAQLEAEATERESLRALIDEVNAERERTEQQLNGAYQRINEDENIRNKAVQALEIAVALLKEAGFTNAEAVLEGEGGEARS